MRCEYRVCCAKLESTCRGLKSPEFAANPSTSDSSISRSYSAVSPTLRSSAAMILGASITLHPLEISADYLSADNLPADNLYAGNQGSTRMRPDRRHHPAICLYRILPQ